LPHQGGEEIEEMKRMTKSLMILAVAVAPVACTNLSPTSPSEATSAETSFGGVASASGRAPRTPFPGTPCQAQGIVLARTGPMLVTAQLVDGNGSPVPTNGCSAIGWSVSPHGAFVYPTSTGTVGSATIELVITGSAQTYTVTATLEKLTASIDLAF
jgi:hypothetical protein